MAYFLAHYWIWLAAAFVAGALTALSSRRSEAEAGLGPRAADLALTVCVLVFVAFAKIATGRLALYCESALWTLGVFLAGAAVGFACNGFVVRDRLVWRSGAAFATMLWLASNLSAAPHLEDELRNDAGAVVELAGGNGRSLEVRGRDVLLPTNVGGRRRFAGKILTASGARYVLETGGLSAQAARRLEQENAEAAARSKRYAERARASSASRPDIAWKPPADVEAAGKPSLGAKPAYESGVALAAIGREDEAPLSASVASACRDGLRALGRDEKILFRSGSAAIEPPAARTLDKFAAELKRCNSPSVEIAGHADSVGTRNEALSRRRAEAVVRYLREKGGTESGLTPASYGASQPVAPNDTAANRARNRRVELTIP